MLSVLAALTLQVAAARPMVVPVLDSVRPSSELRLAGRRYAPAIRGCYEREGLRRDPALTGTLDVSVTIGPHGAVQRVNVDTLDVRGVGMREVVHCVARSATSWRFSAGRFALEVTTYTFRLVPSDSTRVSGPSGGGYSYRSPGSAEASSTKYAASRATTSSR